MLIYIAFNSVVFERIYLDSGNCRIGLSEIKWNLRCKV